MSSLRELLTEVLSHLGIAECSSMEVEFENGNVAVVTSPDDPILDSEEPVRRITPKVKAEAGAYIKVRGDRWLVNQNDPDPWPSDFHAHNLDRREKMDCYTGYIYDIRSRQIIRRYNRKKLAKFHARLPPSLKRF